MNTRFAFKQAFLMFAFCAGMTQAWSDAPHPLVQVAMTMKAALAQNEGRISQAPLKLKLSPDLPSEFQKMALDSLQKQVDESIQEAKAAAAKEAKEAKAKGLKPKSTSIPDKYTVTKDDLQVFSDPELEYFRHMLLNFRDQIRETSDEWASRSDRKLEPLVQASQVYLEILYRVHLLFARAAYNSIEVDPEDVWGKMSRNLSQYSWDQLDAGLIVSRRAGLLLIGALDEAQFPTKARHVKNGDTANLDIEFVITEEQKQFAEFLVLARDPADWTYSFIEDRMNEGQSFDKGRLGKRNPYSFTRTEDYARILQFVAVRDSLVNRYTLNKLFDKPVSERTVEACGQGFLSFRPNETKLMRGSDAYQELGANDRWKRYSDKLSELGKLVQDRPVLSPQQSGAIVNKIGEDNADVINVKNQDTYYMEQLSIGAENVEVENALFQQRMDSILKLSSLNGDELTAGPAAERLARIVFRFRSDAHKKVIRENLQKDTPTLKGEVIEKAVDAALAKRKQKYIDALKSAIMTELADLDRAANTPKLAKQFYDAKIEQYQKTLAAAGPASWENQKIADMSDKEKLSPMGPEFRNQINDPAFLKIFFDAKKTEYEIFSKLYRQPDLEGIPEKILEDIAATYEKLPEPEVPVTGPLPPSRGAAFYALGAEMQTHEANPSRYWDRLANAVSQVATFYANEYPYDEFQEALDESMRHKSDGLVVVNPKLTAYEKRKIYTTNEVVAATLKVLNLKPRKKMVLLPETPEEKKKREEAAKKTGIVKPLPNVTRWVVDIKKNRQLTPNYRDQALLNSFIIAMAEQSNVILASTWEVSKVDNPYDDVRPIRPAHYLTYKRKSVVQQVGMFAYDPKTGVVDTKIAKRILDEALNRAHKAAGGLVEDFCVAHPNRWKDQETFGKIFQAMTATRMALMDGNKDIAAMDEQMRKEFRTVSEKVKDAIASPYGIVGIALIVAFVLPFLVPLMPMLGPVAAVFAPGAIGAVALKASFISLAVLNLSFNSYATWIDAPARAAYNTKVAQSQVDGDTVASWAAVRAENKAVGIKKLIWLPTSLIESWAVTSMGSKALAGLKRFLPGSASTSGAYFSVRPLPSQFAVPAADTMAPVATSVGSKLKDLTHAFSGYFKRLGHVKRVPKGT